MGQGIYSPKILEWMDKVMENRGKNAKELLDCCDQIQQYGEKVNDCNLLGFAQYYKGETYYLLNYVDGMFRSLIGGVENLKRAGVHELEASAYNLLGIVSVNQGNAHFALDYYLSGLQICEQYDFPKVRAMIEYNIGALYFKYQDYPHALECFGRSRRLFLKQKDMTPNVCYADISIASCYLEKNEIAKAKEYMEYAEAGGCPVQDNLTKLYLWCFQARFYDSIEDIVSREEYIFRVTENISEKMPIMEVFDDLYIYCKMLLRTEHYEELKRIVQVMEKVTAQVDILYLRRNVLSLKIEMFKNLNQQDKYLKAAAEYYEMDQKSEQENYYVINSIMGIRFSLEEARKRSREIEKENRMLQQKSEVDPLTGISNRFRLNDYAEEAFQRAYLEQETLGVEILDVDYFKEYNDNYGHQKGDRCLVEVSRALEEIGRNRNIFCARYGGDEFIILYQDYSPQEVIGFAKQLKYKMEELNIVHEFAPSGRRVSLSQGICIDVPKEGNRVWDYLHCADEMLYLVKKNCRSGIILCDGSGKIQAQEIGSSI